MKKFFVVLFAICLLACAVACKKQPEGTEETSEPMASEAPAVTQTSTLGDNLPDPPAPKYTATPSPAPLPTPEQTAE